MADYPQAFKLNDTIPVDSACWYKTDGRGPLRLGRVVGQADCYLIVQIGPDRYRDVIVGPLWTFYAVAPDASVTFTRSVA